MSNHSSALDAVCQRLAECAASHPLNRASGPEGERIYDQPLVAVASAQDPLYLRLREEGVVGPHHLLPSEWLPGAASVVSYFLPFAGWIRTANHTPGMVAGPWVLGRFQGEAFNDYLRAALAGVLVELGGQVIVPPHSPRFRVAGRRSNWSERHSAFIAGLGTFGLSRSLITARGSAGRLGSAVTTLALPPGPRGYQGPYDWCPWMVSRDCGVCISRCPAGAIGEGGKDNAACAAYLDQVVRRDSPPRYGCGKCQTAVPCEAGLPHLIK